MQLKQTNSYIPMGVLMSSKCRTKLTEIVLLIQHNNIMILASASNGCSTRYLVFIYLNCSISIAISEHPKGFCGFWELHVVLINTDVIKSESTTHNEAIIFQAKNKYENPIT